jgi:predicted ATPase
MRADQYVRSIELLRKDVPSFAEYPFSLPVFSAFEKLELHPKLTYFVGENGSGKSTLLEALAVSLGYNAEGGTKNFNFATHESHSTLHRYLRVVKGLAPPRDGFFLRAESFFNVATAVENLGVENSYGGASLHAQSHGESFLSLFEHRFRGRGLYLLDEPEAALSPQRQLTVLSRIHNLVQSQSQFVIATHAPILMAYPDALIYQFSAEGIHPIEYEQTEHYQVTRRFLADREGMLERLFNDRVDSLDADELSAADAIPFSTRHHR